MHTEVRVRIGFGYDQELNSPNAPKAPQS